MGASCSRFQPAFVFSLPASSSMPSTHSAAMTFIATYIPLAAIYLPIHPAFPSSYLVSRVLPILIVVPCASVVVQSRITLGHHTWPQAGVGCAVGAAFAFLWFKLWVGGLDGTGVELEAWLTRTLQTRLGV